MVSPDLSKLSIAIDSSSANLESAKDDAPSHRSHTEPNNLKRSDPFKFGSRYLDKTDDVFEFNAWDHVTPDESYHQYAEGQYFNQRQNPVAAADRIRFYNEPEKWWNKFYSNNTSNFFKDRKWLHQEFPILTKLTRKDAGPVCILEVGAGAGNTAFPILNASENEHLKVYALDFSKKAVELIRTNAQYDERNIVAEVWDIASDTLPSCLEPGNIDVVLLVFIFSALSPAQWTHAVRNVWRLLKPGGEVCFRDYGRGDLTQVRFKKGRLLEESFYIRGDGTRVYFFEVTELANIWSGESAKAIDGAVEPVNSHHPFEICNLDYDRRLLVNRQKQLKMYRCWLQGHFKKPAEICDTG